MVTVGLFPLDDRSHKQHKGLGSRCRRDDGHQSLCATPVYPGDVAGGGALVVDAAPATFAAARRFPTKPARVLEVIEDAGADDGGAR